MPRRKAAPAPAPGDPRTVEVVHPEHGTEMVTPEVARALEGQKRFGWTRTGTNPGEFEAAVEKITAPLHARIAELEAGGDDARIAELVLRNEELETQLAAANEALAAATSTPPEGGNPADDGQKEA